MKILNRILDWLVSRSWICHIRYEGLSSHIYEHPLDEPLHHPDPYNFWG